MARISRPRRAKRLYLKQVLFFYDGPQVVLMQSDRGFPAVGVAIEGDGNWFMHFSEVSDEALRRYMSEKAQLSWLFNEASKRRYLGAWGEVDEQGWLRVKSVDDIRDESWFPQPGFWARNHTTPFGSMSAASDKVASFAIDGSWDASDFSKFYGKMADLYALLAITSERAASHLTVETRRVAKDAIVSAAWRGGGSYVSFYDRIFSSVFALSPLRVRRIAYASPGHIDLKGSEEPLRDIARVVDSFGLETSALKAAVADVNKILTDGNLRSADATTQFPSDVIRDRVYQLCREINTNLGVDDPQILYNLCDDNVLVYAKITLSFYRRAKDLYAFHTEGRVDPVGFVSEDEPVPSSAIKAM